MNAFKKILMLSTAFCAGLLVQHAVDGAPTYAGLLAMGIVGLATAFVMGSPDV